MDLGDWIGREETAEDGLTPRLVNAFNATFDLPSTAEDVAPLGLHWCLAPPAAPAAALGADGHPAKGSFLPPVALPRRMWAGGALQFHDLPSLGDHVTRRSRIADISIKEGRSGTLCFVAVDHEISTSRGLAITERQDIVYREAASGPAPPATPSPPATAQWRQPMRADPVLLFRYSALTFNGHRIHYDRPYAMDVEHYTGLVVHGPLQATWLLGFAAQCAGQRPRRFSFRGLSPLMDFEPCSLCAGPVGDGLVLWVEAEGGRRTMAATASF